MRMRSVSVLKLGRMSYCKALKVQERLVARTKACQSSSSPTAGSLVLVEHPPVYTTGLRSKVYSRADEERLLALGADFVRTNRGGLITYHGPGQLVAYPVLDLRQFVPEQSRRKAMLGMKWYVSTLEECVLQLLSRQWGLQGHRSPHTGVWLDTRGQHRTSKVCAIGVHSSDMVTSHGLALNCSTDMDWFGHIVPCGIQGAGVTSLQEVLGRGGQDVMVDQVGDMLVEQFQETFDCCTSPVADIVREELLEDL